VAREVVERILAGYDRFNRGELEEALAGFTDEVEWVVPEQFLEAGTHKGREGVRKFWDLWHETFVDFRLEVEEVHDLTEHVVVIARIHGTGRDSGAPVTTPSFPQVWTIDDGVITRVEMFGSSDAVVEAIKKDWRENRPSRLE
jgi:ketosteroid isomerase-like protein